MNGKRMENLWKPVVAILGICIAAGVTAAFILVFIGKVSHSSRKSESGENEEFSCYECVYVDGMEFPGPPIRSEDSCKAGLIPTKELIRTCSRPGITEFVCGKLILVGSYLNTTATIRTCLPSLKGPRESEECKLGTLLDLAHNGTKEWSSLLQFYLWIYHVNPLTIVRTCKCSDDKCNSGEVLAIVVWVRVLIAAGSGLLLTL